MAQEKLHGTYSSARIANGIVFTSGRIGLNAEGERPEEFAEEVRAALASLAEIVVANGSNMSELLQVHCILNDMSLFEEFNRVYTEVMPEPVPPRFTHSGGLVQNFRFEIVATAKVVV